MEPFLFILEKSATANPSDLWHHVVYRLYCDLLPKYRPQDPSQSWVRASGDALEAFFEQLYAPVLLPHGIKVKALISRQEKRQALMQMGLSALIGDAKLDVALYVKCSQGNFEIFGGVHVKTSMAERVSDDIPCSRAMMNAGLWSPFWTLDVKSFPPPKGDLVNRGEFGSPSVPSQKRIYVENHGDFDNAYSANSRTLPTVGATSSGKNVYSINPSAQPDQFAIDAIKAAENWCHQAKSKQP